MTGFSLPPVESVVLFILTVLVLIGTQVPLKSQGWLDEFATKPAKTGMLLLDVLIEMFLQTIGDPVGCSAWFLIAGMVPIGSNLVVIEGSRRRGPGGGFSQLALAAYWWISQFVAIGVATPLFLGLFLMKPVKNSQLDHVGLLRATTALTALVGASALAIMMEHAILRGASDIVVPLVAAFCLFPVLLISCVIITDRNSSSAPSSGRYLIHCTYAVCALLGFIMHLRLVVLLMSGRFSYTQFMLNSPAISLLVDALGLIASVYFWLANDGRISVFEQWQLFFLCGPAVHVSYLGFARDRVIEQAVQSSMAKAA